MWIIGCDFHPSFQQVAWCNTETGETGEVKLDNVHIEISPRVPRVVRHGE